MNDVHAGQGVARGGASPENARAAMIMIHGRGASAESILSLAALFGHDDVAYVAPQAAGMQWYPNSFLAPIPSNEPGITSGMNVIGGLLDELAAAGLPRERVILLGFSQGACLSTEYVARHAQRYGGVAGLSGGLIGPDGTPRDYAGSLNGTPVFLGCSDVDFHIPAARVRETEQVLSRLGAEVDMRLYRGMGHTVNEEEIAAVIELIERIG